VPSDHAVAADTRRPICFVAVAAQRGIGRHEGEWCAAALTSSRPHFEPDADLSGIIFGEMNASLLESFLYFDDSRELSFLNAFVSFNALQGRQA
jgi:hypothetical protein